MTLNEDLADFLATRPNWQKDVVVRFCRNETLSIESVSRIADKLIVGAYEAVADINVADIPGSTASGDAVSLIQVSNVSGVNALIEGQTLSFGTNGLTIAFGNNASGKSGYARLIREAVTARVKDDQLLGDVFSDVEIEQAATIDFSVGGGARTWNLGKPQDSELSRIRFYDEDCGDAYVMMASEVSYRPSALTILDQLSDACEAVATELGRRLSANQAERPRLPVLHQGTPSFIFLSGISATTSNEAIVSSTTLSDDYRADLAKALAEESRLNSSDPNKEKGRLVSLSRDWSTVETHAWALETALGDNALQALKKQQARTVQLQAAARIASARTFDSEPLTSVGSETWRALWEAAREFSLTDAYHEHDFPFTDDGAVCVLCQQPLNEQAADRLRRFEEFITDTTSRDADAAVKELAIRRGGFTELQSLPGAVSAAMSRIQDSGEDTDWVRGWFEAGTRTAAAAVAWLDEVEGVDTLPLKGLISDQAGTRARALRTEAQEIDASAFAQILAVASRKVLELQDAVALSEARMEIEAEVARLVQRKKIEDARRLTATNAITTKRAQLTETYVTGEVRDHFTRETERLKLRRVTLDRVGRGRASVLEHRPSLLGSRRNAVVDKVLSEGEQTALGLAGFLTEVELDRSLSCVVLDDPVSSLDAERRSKVAERLVELASHRQVIVFTHEITFVHALVKATTGESVAVTTRSIQRMGGTHPGLVANQFPWAAKDVGQRIDELGRSLARLRRDRESLSEDDYTPRTAQIAGRLSETLERAVSLHIVNELVDRGTNEVRPVMLKILPLFTQKDQDEFQSIYAKASSWAARHDNAPEEDYKAPEVDELAYEIERLKDWYLRVKKYSR